jgi:WD40 repeat protein
MSLRDGRLLSWSQDKSLRMWDGATGAALATLEGHTEAVHGAVTLPDGRLLSWSDDGTLRLWDTVSGAALFAVNQTGVEYVEPELHRAWRRALNSGAWQALASAAALGHQGGPHLWFYPPARTTIPWHADGSWTARHLLPDGTLVATCDKHLAILHLHRGNRRICLEDAEALLAAGSA